MFCLSFPILVDLIERKDAQHDRDLVPVAVTRKFTANSSIFLPLSLTLILRDRKEMQTTYQKSFVNAYPLQSIAFRMYEQL